jgi:hypothetical protein
MKNILSLLTITLCLLLSGIIASAQSHSPVQVIIPEQVSRGEYSNSQKGDKDTTQQRIMIMQKKDTALQRKMIIIQKRLEERNKDLLDIQKELKDLHSSDQFNISPVPPQYMKFLTPKFGMMSGNNDLSELRLMKSFKGESVETTKRFSVTADNTSLNFNLSGQVKSGIISVTLFKPNGSKYKAIEIDPTSDISFSQGIDLKKDPKEWTGEWQIKIKAEKADGDYRLTILTR